LNFYLLTFDLETACCMLRVFPHCPFMMSLAIFETVSTF
jgi:hypothetical protein